MKKLFKIGLEDKFHLKSNGTPYFITEYTNEYSKYISAWKIVCIKELDYWENKMHNSFLKEEIYYERDFQEYDQFYNFNPPARKPSELTNYVNERIAKIIEAPKYVDKVLSSEYNLYKGLIKEELLREFLKELLDNDIGKNQDIGIGTGFVVNKAFDIKSKQIDIIIYKKPDKKSSFVCGSFVIMDVKNVLATIEIKTRLNKVELFGNKKKTGALSNQLSISKIDSTKNTHIIKCIIGYENSCKDTKIFEEGINEFYRKRAINTDNIYKTLPNLISTLDGFCVHFGLNSYSKPSIFYSNSPEGISGFQVFYTSLLSSLNNIGIQCSNMRDYYNMIDGENYRTDNPLGIDWKEKIIENG